MKQLREKEIRELLAKNELNTALHLAQREIAKDPQNVMPYVLASRAALQGGNIHTAKSFLSQAQSIAPQDKDVIAGLLRCAVQEGHQSAAEGLLARLGNDVSSDLVLLAKAEYYRACQRLHDELCVLETGHEKFPESMEITMALIRSLTGNNPDDPRILALIDEALKTSSQPEELYQEKMRFLYQRGDYDACSALCRNVARKFPGTAVAMHAQNLFKTIAKKRMENNRSQPVRKKVDADEALAKLDGLIGLEGVKREVHAIKKKLDYEQKRAEALGVKESENTESYHFVFMGNPGTGKTTVARLIGDIFAAYGILKDGHLVETSRVDLVSQYIGDTAIKTQEVVDKALGGVLFIDEAYSLINGDNDSAGREALDTLVKNIEDHRTEFIVILAGYKDEMHNLLNENPGLESRFRMMIDFEDYSDEELFAIAESYAKEKHYSFSEEGKRAFLIQINRKKVNKSFGNARAVRNMIEDAILEKARNFDEEHTEMEYFTIFQPKDFGIDNMISPEERIRQATDELNHLIGLAGVKNEVDSMISIAKYIKESQAAGEMVSGNPLNLNMIFTGSPGTGKTTVARIYSELLTGLGILKKGGIVEVTRSDLVGRYQGHTAVKTREVCEKAYGGVLFIDEAYSLYHDELDTFGAEAIATLLTEMENNHDKLVVILAGYSREMEAFMDANSGIKSRIGKTIEFSDYTAEELYEIFVSLCKKGNITMDEEACMSARVKLNEMYVHRDKHFGNARSVRNLYESCWKNMVRRVEKDHLTGDERHRFVKEDIESA